jgi:hypothetical protein
MVREQHSLDGPKGGISAPSIDRRVLFLLIKESYNHHQHYDNYLPLDVVGENWLLKRYF